MTMQPCSVPSIMLIAALSLPASAQSLGDRRAPLGPEAFAQKIVALIQAGDGYVTRDSIEKALAFQFARTKTGDGFGQYSIDQGSASYFSAALQQFSAPADAPDGALSVAILGWKDYTFGNPVAGVCVDLRTFEDALKHAGWYLGYAAAHPIHFDEFYKNPDRVDRQSVTVYPDENCVISVKIQGTRKTHAK